jgi:hypothetical protein
VAKLLLWCCWISALRSTQLTISLHQTLIDVLRRRFAIDGVPLSWFESYLTNRMQSFTMDGVKSVPNKVSCGVPHGSVLGPLEFSAYTEEVTSVETKSVTICLLTTSRFIVHV